MVYKGKGKKGSRIVEYMLVRNKECEDCLYRKRGSCSGRHDAINPCLFAKTQENDKIDNWVQY